MRIIKHYIICCFLMLLFSSKVCASIPEAYSSLISTHTITPPSIESEPLSSVSKTVKVAAIYWLPDYLESFSSNLDDDTGGGTVGDPQCTNYGFVASCPGGQSGETVSPVTGVTCYKNCQCASSYTYTSSNCKSPYYLEGASCTDSGGKKYAKCTLNVEEGCKGYVQTCQSGWQLETGNRCQYESSYGKCCNKCEGYTVETIPDGYVEASHCDSCNGKRYTIKENPCEGYTTCQYGAAVGSKTCKSGSTVKYNDCKKCLFECNLSTCPAGAVCRKEECSGRYCITGCASGYIDFDTYWCNGALKCWWKN